MQQNRSHRKSMLTRCRQNLGLPIWLCSQAPAAGALFAIPNSPDFRAELTVTHFHSALNKIANLLQLEG